MSVKAYAIRNRSSPGTYVGTTTKPYLCQRLAGHLYDLREHKKGNTKWVSSFQVLECPTATIELLEDLGDCDKATRYARERWWIENTPNCVNSHYKPPTADEIAERRRKDTEKMRAWRTENPGKDAERARLRRQDPVVREEENRRQRERRRLQSDNLNR